MYQPLKRFTQCGSLTMLFGTFIVLFGVSSTALSTFGKSNTQNQQPTPPPAKDCIAQTDCYPFRDTSCVRDYVDNRLRCLCGDNKPPINGFCTAKFKGLRHICTNSNQCDEGMICSTDNTTKTAVGYKNAPAGNNKLCLCDDELGYVESIRANVCSGTITIVTGVLLPLLSLVLGSIVAKKPMTYYNK